MSMIIAKLQTGKETTRAELLALVPAKEYKDGRTKQCHADECNISKIMARFDKTGTISHLAKHQGVYADFSDFDFFEQTQKLTRGREIFDELPAEIRKEFGQSPAAFFEFVNDPANEKELRSKLPGLAKPGQQLPRTPSVDADLDKADKAASELASKPTTKTLESSEKSAKEAPGAAEA